MFELCGKVPFSRLMLQAALLYPEDFRSWPESWNFPEDAASLEMAFNTGLRVRPLSLSARIVGLSILSAISAKLHREVDAHTLSLSHSRRLCVGPSANRTRERTETVSS